MSKQPVYSMINDHWLWWLFGVLLFLLVTVTLALPVPTTASPMAVGGTGPGGVGATTGSDTLELWLRSDRPVFNDTSCSTEQTTNGGPVACWPDNSGNENHALQSNSSHQPSLVSSGINTLNNNPVLGFDGDDVLITDDVMVNDFTIFALVRNTSFERMFYEQSPNANGNDGLYMYSSVASTVRVYRNLLASTKDLSSDWGSLGSYLLTVQRYAGTHATHTLFVGGTEQALASGTSNDPTGVVVDEFYIGARGASGNIGITGNYAEFIVYSEALNTAQRTIVENYLQAKYNITIANDRYDGDTTGNGNFDLDVAGIGQEADGSHTRAHSAGMIVEDNTFLQDNGDYLLFGHRTLTNSNVTTNLPTTGDWPTAPNPQRWERHWYIDVTDVDDNGGTVDIIFDFSEGGMGGGSGPTGPVSNYRLLGRVDFGPLDNFTEVFTATAISGDQVIFAGVPVTLLGSNFTLGSIDATASPTAIGLQTAAASPLSSLWLPTMVVMLLLTAGTWVRLRRRGYENEGY